MIIISEADLEEVESSGDLLSIEKRKHPHPDEYPYAKGKPKVAKEQVAVVDPAVYKLLSLATKAIQNSDKSTLSIKQLTKEITALLSSIKSQKVKVEVPEPNVNITLEPAEIAPPKIFEITVIKRDKGKMLEKIRIEEIRR